MSRSSLLEGLRIEPLRVRVDRNRVRFVVFLIAFVLGSAVLLTAAFVAVPGSLIGLIVGDQPTYYSWLGIVIAASFGVLLVAGSIAVYSQVSNAEHWVHSQFQGKKFPADKHPGLVRAVEEIALAGGLPQPPRLMLLAVPSVNACAIGATRKRPVIGVTQGFVDSLTVDEQRAVMATLVARITRGDILVGTALAALMGPLKVARGLWGGIAGGAAAEGGGGNTAGCGDGCDAGCGSGCGDGCGDLDVGGDDCLGGILVILFLIVVAVITLVAITIAIWLVTMWGRALHRTGHEKADAEGMLLLRDPLPMLSALRKAITSSNEIADGDPSYDGIFYASTSGKPGIDKVERRRYDRLREVLGVEGLAAALPEEDSAAGGETPAKTDAEGGAGFGAGMPIADYFDEKAFLDVVPAEALERGAAAAEHGRVEILQRGALSLRCRVTVRAAERGRDGARTHETRFWVEDEELKWSCTCGDPEPEPCEHAVASALAAWRGEGTSRA